jgi:hypothetical protein
MRDRGYGVERVLAYDGDSYAVLGRRPEVDGEVQSKTVTVYPGREQHQLMWDGQSYYWDGERFAEAAELDTAQTLGFPEDVAKDGFGRVRELLLLNATFEHVRALHDPYVIGRFPPGEAGWISLSGDQVDTFWMTLGNENRTWTVIWNGGTESVDVIFQDDPGSCTAARLDDLNEDGIVELIVSGDDVARDCLWLCPSTLRRNGVPLSPAWFTVQEWRGGRFVPAPELFPLFYDSLANEYDAAATEYDAASATAYERGASALCPPGISERLRDWGVRARVLAQSGR